MRRLVRAVWRWIGPGLAAVLVPLALLSLPLGCTISVRPPAEPADPVNVYILDHGYTPSLVLPTADDGMVRFAYGDWRYYALAERGPISTFRALLWPSTGALGWREMPGPASERNIVNQTLVHIDNIHRVPVDREQVDALRDRLESLRDEAGETEVLNPGADLYFVHHPYRYTYFYNSNHAVADWLRELDCDVRGLTFISNWQIESDEP